MLGRDDPEPWRLWERLIPDYEPDATEVYSGRPRASSCGGPPCRVLSRPAHLPTSSPDISTLEGFKVIALRSSSERRVNRYPGQQLQPAPVIDQKTVSERLKGIKYHRFLNLLRLSNKKKRRRKRSENESSAFSLSKLK